MRVFTGLLILACSGCTPSVPTEWQAAVGKLEQSIKLPEGAGSLRCYERHYVVLRQNEAEKYLGLRQVSQLREGLLIGSYFLPGDGGSSSAGKPGIYWVSGLDELPNAKVQDEGCSILSVVHALGDKRPPLEATCGFTIAGEVPERISPPVHC